MSADDITNLDILALLEEIGKEAPAEEFINLEVREDADQVAGADEVDDILRLLLDGPDLDREEIIEHIASGAAEARKSSPQKQYPMEQPSEIDDISSAQMMSLLFAEIRRKKISGHHIDSMNSFIKVGIKQIVTKIFAVDGRLKNLRDKTDEDREIEEITFRVDFTDVTMAPPSTVKYKSGTSQMMTPVMAKIKGSTYKCPIFLDATITATATFKSGATKTRTAEIKDHRIGAVPCMVGTDICATHNCSADTLKNLGEDPKGLGGYFICKGLEMAIDNLENTTNNTFHVHKNMYMNEIARGTFLSKPGDAFENSYQVILRYLNSGAITIEITTNKFDKFEVPYYLIFRALGMTRDRDIVDHIVYGVDNTDQTTIQMMKILEDAFEADDATFGAIKKSTVPTDIIQFIATRITEGANPTAAKKDENIAKYLNTNIINIIDRYIFPHIGTAPEHRIKKLRFFGHLINKLLGVVMGVTEPTDRDSYKNKRVHAAGTSIAKTFKTSFNFAVNMEVKKHLLKDFKSTPFSQVQLAESVKAAIPVDDLERLLIQAIITGNKTITIKRNEIMNRISSQALYYKNDLNVKSTLSTINTPNSSASKQNERADVMRRVHPTYLGMIDISQSADSGEKVGTTKQMACSASICGASSSFVVKNILAEDPEIIPLDDVSPSQISSEKLTKVFVNGDWIGLCKNAFNLAAKYRVKRRHGDLHYSTSIVCELLTRELYFWTDFGRIMRPLIIVYNNLQEYVDAWRAGDKTVQFKQWIKLTRDHILRLQAGEISMETLRDERVIEYVSAEEQENTFIAVNINKLRKNQSRVDRKYSHCDIDQAIFGVVTLASPMPNHSNAVRNTMYTNHRKQSVGWNALNFAFRVDKNSAFQHYAERPLVSTFSDALTHPNGHNTIVALALQKGYNQEDSIIANQSSIDCGAFQAAFYNYEKVELDKNEQFGNSDFARTTDIKKDANYEFIEDGFIAKNTHVKKGYVLAVKAAKNLKPVDQYIYSDKSVVYKKNEEAYVEQVITTRNDDDVMFAKIKLRSDRPMAIGDKFSSRTGNKGICAAKWPRVDMMYTETGLTPDLVVNPHSIPTRMAVNQIIECLLGQLAAHLGTHIDATAFREYDLDGVIAKLEKDYGIKYGGHRRMYNGCTGEWIDTLIFIGPTTYQRLQKFVIDEHYASRTGPLSAMTHQPLDGKNNDGGLRIGEMEKDVICGHGAARTLFGKFNPDSDGITIHVCLICGNRAVVNEKEGFYKCKECLDAASIVKVESTWVANTFFNEASAMNVKMTFDMAPHLFAKQES